MIKKFHLTRVDGICLLVLFEKIDIFEVFREMQKPDLELTDMPDLILIDRYYLKDSNVAHERFIVFEYDDKEKNEGTFVDASFMYDGRRPELEGKVKELVYQLIKEDLVNDIIMNYKKLSSMYEEYIEEVCKCMRTGDTVGCLKDSMNAIISQRELIEALLDKFAKLTR